MIDSIHATFIPGWSSGLIEMDHSHLLVQLLLVAHGGPSYVLIRLFLVAHDGYSGVVPSVIPTACDSLERYTWVPMT